MTMPLTEYQQALMHDVPRLRPAMNTYSVTAVFNGEQRTLQIKATEPSLALAEVAMRYGSVKVLSVVDVTEEA